MQKRILVMLGVIAFLGAVYGVTWHISSRKPSENIDNALLIHNFDKKSFSSVEIVRDGTVEKLYKDHTGRWQIHGYEELPVNDNMVEAYLSTISAASGRRMIDENPEELSIFGLEDPQSITRIFFEDGKSYGFLIGSYTPDKEARYVKSSDKPEVYIISSVWADTYLNSYQDMLINQFLPEVEPRDVAKITKLVFTGRKRSENVLIERRSISGNSGYSAFIMKEPKVCDVDEGIMTSIISELTGVMRGNIYKIFPTEQDIRSAGLDHPSYSVTVTIDGVEHTLMIGNPAGDGRYYAIRKGVDILFTVSDARVAWILLETDSFYSKTSFIHDNSEEVLKLD